MDSILVQALTDWELIVCDSYSDDGTWEYLQQFKDDPRVRLYQVPKEGLYAGWNECLRRCRGEYVYIATADDTMAPECLERMVAALEAAKTLDHRPESLDPLAMDTQVAPSVGKDCLMSNVQCLRSSSDGLMSNVYGLRSDRPRPIDLCVCRYERIDAEGRVSPDKPGDLDRFYGDRMDVPHVRSGMLEFLAVTSVGCHWDSVTAMLFRRALNEKIGSFQTDCGNSADQIWRWKALLYSDVAYLPDRLATWRVHDEQSTSRSQLPDAKWYYDQIAKILDEFPDLFPESWKRNRDWKRRILFHAHKEMLKAFGLDRSTFHKSPRIFFSGLAACLIDNPRYLFHRIANGFNWDDPWLEDEVAFVRRLVDQWNV